MTDIGAGAIETLRMDFSGVVSQAGRVAYDDAVNIWNGAITRRPAVVASCASSSDVRGRPGFRATAGTEGVGSRWRTQLCRICSL